MKTHIKVLTALSLAASDTREDTLTSIIISTVFENDVVNEKILLKSIENMFGFEPFADEVNELKSNLITKNRIIKNTNGDLTLSDSELKGNQILDLKIKDREKARFENFKNFITDTLNSQIDINKIKSLWVAFVQYLYSNFYEFGEDALANLHPFLNQGDKFKSDNDFMQEAYSSLKDKELSSIFKQTVDKFPDYASSDDIDFLNDLAQKTLAFTSLGFDPSVVDSNLDKTLIDWVLYLDTNVLYSLLDLHSHPENSACKALITLIKGNKQHIKIALRYSELTKKELNAKGDEFKLLNDSLSDSSIRALLRSNHLDDFSRQYYENLLNNRKATLHPSKVIEIAPSVLIRDAIDISRNQKRVEKIGEEYLNTRIQDYRRFINEKNSIREQFNTEKKANFRSIEKSDKQIIHDVTLREIILDQRSSILKQGKIPSLNSVKYFGVTLDGLLLDYDKNQVKDYNNQDSFPVFFRPSYLLNKLIRILPIKTDDYKKAFIKALTSKGFNKDVQKSHDVLKIVNYLKSRGIDNENIIFNIISEDLFLEKYKKTKNNPDFNQAEFIESELNREYSQKEQELHRTQEDLLLKTTEAQKHSTKSTELEDKKNSLEKDLVLYKNALEKLKETVSKLERRSKTTNLQSSIDFESGPRLEEINKLKRKLKIEIADEIRLFKNLNFKSWQRRVWWNLFWVVPITLLCLTIILVPSIISGLTIDSVSTRIILGFLLLLLDGIFVIQIRMRYWDEGNKQKKQENIVIPNYLQQKLDDNSDD